MKRILAAIALFVLGIVPGSNTPFASTIRSMSLDELVATADRIVVVTVSSTQARWDAEHRRIHSTIEVDVEEAWKGDVRTHERLTLVQPGGTIGDIEMTVIGMPRFAAGERSLLFLKGRAHAQVVGMAQGQRPLRWDRAGRRWLVSPADASAVVQTGPPSSDHGQSADDATTLAELRRRVQALMAKE
jgi:hypothetical protein